MLAGQCSLVLPPSDSLRLCHAALHRSLHRSLHGSSGPADSRGAVHLPAGSVVLNGTSFEIMFRDMANGSYEAEYECQGWGEAELHVRPLPSRAATALWCTSSDAAAAVTLTRLDAA